MPASSGRSSVGLERVTWDHEAEGSSPSVLNYGAAMTCDPIPMTEVPWKQRWSVWTRYLDRPGHWWFERHGSEGECWQFANGVAHSEKHREVLVMPPDEFPVGFSKVRYD